MEPSGILDHVRHLIREHAGDDPDKWWYANRFVFARLMLDERKTKTAIKKNLFAANPYCHVCRKPLDGLRNVHIHRLDGDRGYSEENCVLMHGPCHQNHHRETAAVESTVPSTGMKAGAYADPVLTKRSKRYDGSFLYWWDIPPALAAQLDRFESVEFACKDSGLLCSVAVQDLSPLLTEARRTSRGNGNWGIKVLKDHEDELAVEPGTGSTDWAYLPVIWADEEEGD